MTLNLIQTFEIIFYNTKHTNIIKLHIQKSFYFQKSIFFKKYKFIKIRVFRLFSWPAFGGAKILVYIYIYIHVHIHIPHYPTRWLWRLRFSPRVSLLFCVLLSATSLGSCCRIQRNQTPRCRAGSILCYPPWSGPISLSTAAHPSSTHMAPRWHQGTIAPRALKNKKNIGGNAQKQILVLRAF